MPYAVDLAGLTNVRVRQDFILKMLLVQVLDVGNPVECQADKMAGTGVPFICGEERARAIVAVIRMRYKHWELPIYYSRTGDGSWRYVRGGDLDAPAAA